jgi:hypothetical protein
MKRDNYIVTRNDLNDMLLQAGGGTGKWDWGSDGNRGATKLIMLSAYEARVTGDAITYPDNRLMKYQEVQAGIIPCFQSYDYFVGYQAGACNQQDELRATLIFMTDGAGNFMNEISRDLPSFTVEITTIPISGYPYTTTLTIDPGTLGDTNSWYDTYPWKIYYYTRLYESDPYSGECLGYSSEMISAVDPSNTYCSGSAVTAWPVANTSNPVYQESWATSLQGGVVPSSVTPNPVSNVYLRYFPPRVNGQKWYIQLPAGFYVKDWIVRNFFGQVVASGSKARNGQLDMCYYMDEQQTYFLTYKVFIEGTDIQIASYNNVQIAAVQDNGWACGSTRSAYLTIQNTTQGNITVPFYGMSYWNGSPFIFNEFVPVWFGGVELAPYETISDLIVSTNIEDTGGSPMLYIPAGVSYSVNTATPPSSLGAYSALAIVATAREGTTLDSGGWIYLSSSPHGSNGFRRLTSAGQRIWDSVHKSSDGKYIIGAYYTATPGVMSLLRSSNYGVSWSTLAIGGSGGGKLAMSSSGKYVYVLDSQNYPTEMGVWVSSDYGASFTRTQYFNNISSASVGYMVDIACSLNGQHVTFITQGSIYRSQDWGATWANPVAMGITSVNFMSLTVSGDGRYQLASKGYQGAPLSVYNNWRSSNYGYNWDFQYENGGTNSMKSFFSMSSSDDGKYVIASAWEASGTGVGIWISNSYGRVWTLFQTLSSTYAARYTVMMSPTGQYRVVLPYEGQANFSGSTYAAYYDFSYGDTGSLTILPSSNNSNFRTTRAQYVSAGYR